MSQDDGVSFYFFDIDDNVLFLPTPIYLWNAEEKREQAVNSGEFARVEAELGKPGPWQAWTKGPRTFRDFRDKDGLEFAAQSFCRDLTQAVATPSWQGPAWPLLKHAAYNRRPVAFVTARGHRPETIQSGLEWLVEQGLLPAVPPILGIYTVTNPDVQTSMGARDSLLTVPSLKKLAIKDAVRRALKEYGESPKHRFGMSDDDPRNVVLAISAMRDCKHLYPDKRFFVINTHHDEYVKLEIFPVAHPVTGQPSENVLNDQGIPCVQSATPLVRGGVTKIYVRNMDAAVSFYTGVLGLLLRGRFGNLWAEIDAGNGMILGLHPEGDVSPRAGTIGSVVVELAVTSTLEDAMSELAARGVQFEPVESFENVQRARFYDLDKNPLLLAQVIKHGH